MYILATFNTAHKNTKEKIIIKFLIAIAKPSNWSQQTEFLSLKLTIKHLNLMFFKFRSIQRFFTIFLKKKKLIRHIYDKNKNQYEDNNSFY